MALKDGIACRRYGAALPEAVDLDAPDFPLGLCVPRHQRSGPGGGVVRIQPEIDAGIVRITRRALPVLHRDATVIEGARHFQNRDVGYARAGIQGHRHPVVRAVWAGPQLDLSAIFIARARHRSEEHTSESQALMPNSD